MTPARTALLVLFFAALASLLLAVPHARAQDACTDQEKKPCGSNIGECRQGQKTCVAGEWGPCVGGTDPTNEVCDNGKDDDCDGVADECVDFIGSFGLILTTGGFMLLILAAVLSRVFK
jgi:hypothetical protein